MNINLSFEKLTSYLSTLFPSTEKQEIENEIKNNEECKKVLTLFVNMALSNNTEMVKEQFSKFQNNPKLKNLKFFLIDDINKLDQREKITNKCFVEIYPSIQGCNTREGYNKCIRKIQNESHYPPYFLARNESNITLLINAMRHKNIELAELLLDEDSVYAEENLTSALHVSAFQEALHSSPELTKKLLSIREKQSDQKKISWPTFGILKNSALHIAVDGGNRDVINILLDNYKFPIEDKNICGETALHDASYKDKIDEVKFLIEKKANVNPINKMSNIPLIDCIKQNDSATSNQLISLLLENNASVYLQDNLMQKPVKLAIGKCNIEALKLFHKYNDKTLSKKFAFDHLCENLKHYTDETLHELLKFWQVNQTFFINAGIEGVQNINELFNEVSHDNDIFIKALKLAEQSFLNWQDKYGNTLLLLTIEHNFTKSAKLLIDLKANHFFLNKGGLNALDKMMYCDRPDLVEYFAEKKMTEEMDKNSLGQHQLLIHNIINLSALHGKEEFVESLAKNKHIQKIFNQFPFTTLYVEWAQEEEFNALRILKKHLNINLAVVGLNQWNPTYCTLVDALEGGRKNTAQELIKLGVPYNDIAQDGSTRLHYFIANRNVNAATFLLKQEEINIHIKDSQGRTPLDLALEMELFDTAGYLIEKDDSIFSDSEKLQVLLKKVIKMKSWKALQYILNYGSKNHKHWKKAFENIKNEVVFENYKFVINAFFECCELRSQFFELAKKYNLDVKNDCWEQKPNQLLNESSKKVKNQHWITDQLNENRELLKKLEESLSTFLSVKNQYNEINSNPPKQIDEILQNAKLKCFEQHQVESIQKAQEEALSEIQNVNLSHQKQLEKLRSINIEKTSNIQNPQEQEYQNKIKEQQKEIEELKKQLEKQKEKEKRTEENTKQLKQQIKELKKLSKNKPPKNTEKLNSDSLSLKSPLPIIEESSCKFIEPKNSCIDTLIDCIEENCNSLIKQSTTGLNFENIKNKAMGSLKRPVDLQSLCSEAGFQKPPKKTGSHGGWKFEQTNRITLSTHDGQDNDEGEIKQVLKAILKVLKKHF